MASAFLEPHGIDRRDGRGRGERILFEMVGIEDKLATLSEYEAATEDGLSQSGTSRTSQGGSLQQTCS